MITFRHKIHKNEISTTMFHPERPIVKLTNLLEPREVHDAGVIMEAMRQAENFILEREGLSRK